MNTKLLDTLKEKWTKKSTKIACASVGTAAVLGVVGALIACNVPLTKQVVAEDGTVTTVQTQQKESHGILDLFHAPTEQADAVPTTTTEITPPQTNADGTPITTPAAAPAPGTPINGTVGEAPVPVTTPTQATDDVAAPVQAASAAPASAPAAEQSAEPAEESPAPAPEQKWVKPVWVVDQPEVKAIPAKYNIIHGYMTSDGKFFPYSQQDEAYEYQLKHKLGIGNREKREVIDPGRPYSPEKGHWADPTTGKRLSPTYERSH